MDCQYLWFGYKWCVLDKHGDVAFASHGAIPEAVRMDQGVDRTPRFKDS
jgi:hypothetical protein